LPTEQSARIALRTQQIIGYESGVAQTIDPLAGSYYLETLTNQIEARANEYLGKIDAMGGMLRAIERGYIQLEIQNAAYEYQRAVDQGQAVVVGVNRFELEEEKPIPIQRIDEALEARQVERVRALRARRDMKPWQAALHGVEDAARSGANLMPRILGAVEASATVGEISDAMRRVFGEYQEAAVISRTTTPRGDGRPRPNSQFHSCPNALFDSADGERAAFCLCDGWHSRDPRESRQRS